MMFQATYAQAHLGSQPKLLSCLLGSSAALASIAFAAPAMAHEAAPAAPVAGGQASASADIQPDQPVPSPEAAPPSQPDSSGNVSGAEILVTARRVTERLQDVPLSVVSISQDQIASRAQVNLDDVAKTVPGLRRDLGGNVRDRNDSNFIIRGQSQTNAGSQPAVGVYFAQVPLRAEGSNVPVFDLGSVQVLRGPQGTLFGRNTNGGAILFEPNLPKDHFEGEASIGIGNYSNMHFDGMLNVPIVSDKVMLRMAGEINRRDGTTRTVGGGRMDDRSNEAWRISIRLQPFDNLTNDFVYDGRHTDEEGTSFILTKVLPTGAMATIYGASLVQQWQMTQDQLGPRVSQSVTPGYSKSKIWGISNVTRFDVGETPFGTITLKNIFGYREYDIQRQRDNAGVPAPAFILYNLDFGIRSTSNEFQIIGDSKNVKWIAGGFWSRDKTPNPNDPRWAIQTVALRTALLPLPTMSISDENDSAKAIFGQATISLSSLVEGLSFTAGARHTWDDRSIRTYNVPSDSDGNPIATCATALLTPLANCGLTATGKFEATTWNLDLDYKPSRNVLLYVAARRGYRSGLLPSGNALSRGFTAVTRPEFLNDIEMGIKSSWDLSPTVRGTLNFAAYRGKLTDVQRTLVVGTVPPLAPAQFAYNINGGSAVIKGLELDASISFGKVFTISSNYSLTDAKYTDSVFPTPPTGLSFAGNSSLSGLPFLFTPKHMGSMTATVELPAGELADTIALSTTVLAQSKLFWAFNTVFTPDINEEPGRATIDANLNLKGIAGKRLDLTFYVKNLMNKVYHDFTTVSVPFGYASSIYGDPRTYGMQLRAKF